MKEFLTDDFLLETPTAAALFKMARKLPIIDYHCHINPKEIWEDMNFKTITEAWLGGDHYKWRQLRSNGVEEKYITGDAPDIEKFRKYAETMEKLIGNPLYHWSHLELKNFFGYTGVLNAKTADKVYAFCNKKLKTKEFSVRNLIRRSNVEIICTTDDPIDSLEYHEKLAGVKDLGFRVLPAWRPDKAMSIEQDGWFDYVKKLEKVAGVKITSFKNLLKALDKRMDFFARMGCSVSDHGIQAIPYTKTSAAALERIFAKRLEKKKLTEKEVLQFKTAFMLHMGEECAKRNWVMQLHYGVCRNNNRLAFENLGPDTGFDAISDAAPISGLASFMSALAYKKELPKTIVYSLNPIDNAAIGAMIGCFQEGPVKGKIQHGAAWWFNDQKQGMIDQMTSLASLGILGNFVGMLTDSRSFLSYPRHEYFRRILCNLIGKWVENGEYPNDRQALKKIVEGISYYNAKEYFGF